MRLRVGGPSPWWTRSTRVTYTSAATRRPLGRRRVGRSQSCRGVAAREARTGTALTDNSPDTFWRWQVACDRYPDDFQHILTRYIRAVVAAVLLSGILKYVSLRMANMRREYTTKHMPDGEIAERE